MLVQYFLRFGAKGGEKGLTLQASTDRKWRTARALPRCVRKTRPLERSTRNADTIMATIFVFGVTTWRDSSIKPGPSVLPYLTRARHLLTMASEVKTTQSIKRQCRLDPRLTIPNTTTVSAGLCPFPQDLEAAFRASRRAAAFLAIEKKGKAAFAKVRPFPLAGRVSGRIPGLRR